MFEADDVINLLNGLHGGDDNSCASELFLDEDGLPTDRFLQALKADSVLALTHSAENGKGNSLHKQNHHNHNTVTAADSSEEDDYGSDSESSSSNDSEVQRSSRRKSRKEKPVSQKKGKSKSSGKSSVDKAKREKSCENGKRKKKSDGKKAPEKAIDQFPLVGPFELPSPKTRGKSRSLVLESDSDSKYPQSYRSFLDDKRDKNVSVSKITVGYECLC